MAVLFCIHTHFSFIIQKDSVCVRVAVLGIIVYNKSIKKKLLQVEKRS